MSQGLPFSFVPGVLAPRDKKENKYGGPTVRKPYKKWPWFQISSGSIHLSLLTPSSISWRPSREESCKALLLEVSLRRLPALTPASSTVDIGFCNRSMKRLSSIVAKVCYYATSRFLKNVATPYCSKY